MRLVRLLDAPGEAHFLAPMVKRELVYRLLRGEQGGRVCQIAALGGHAQRIGQAIARRNLFDLPRVAVVDNLHVIAHVPDALLRDYLTGAPGSSGGCP